MAERNQEPWRRQEQEDRAARRETQRRRLRRQRLLAATAIVVVTGAILAVLGSLGAGGSSRPPARNASAGRRAGRKSGDGNVSTGRVRNATPQPGWKPYTGPVPILEYHVLGDPDESDEYPELFVSRPDFRQQLEWLDQNGYQAVTLEQVEDAWYRGGNLPPKPVVLSFDDGYR
ncbi:MAG TPA: hypothetical protein VNB59_03025, partial [Solirubrobacterales bacterium]|nr:hypothetical protein [Solirubrobacterales bacterium]